MSSDPASDFSAFQDGVFGAVMAAVKAAGAVAATDVEFQRTSNADFADAADATGARILELTNALLKSAASGSDITPPVLEDVDDVETKWDDVVEVIDFMLEKADTCLDEYTGAIKHKNPEPLPGARKETPLSRNQQKSQSFRAFMDQPSLKNLPKPQLKFASKPDNMDTSPFKPILTKKPHAKIPLNQSLQMFTNEFGNRQYMHPYIEEIKTMEYPEQIFEHREPIPYLPFEETKAILIDTPELLNEMLQELKAVEEIAIDLEHHDQRSFIGFVCLMQISTRKKDWVVDTLKLRGELEILNEVFADPKIIKVLHGANSDIVWLQRDFGLYIVGLFDTYWAARTLGFQGHGLAFLLKKYADFDADKQYQLADWRIRPLPEEMFNYARADTHYLLYCYDHLRNQLLEASKKLDDPDSKMASVLRNSQEVSLRLYERENYDSEDGKGTFGWRNVLGRSSEGFTPVQVAVFKAVHQWRDTTARVEDDSINYIMPRHQLFNLARKMPEDVVGVLSCCPRPSLPVKMRTGEIATVIKKAKESPEVLEWLRLQSSQAAQATVVKTVTAQEVPKVQKISTDVFAAAPEQIRAMKAETSGFWGDCAYSNLWQATSASSQSAELRLAVPLPPLTAEIFVSPEEMTRRAAQKSTDPGARAEHEYVKNRGEKKASTVDVVTVRSLGGERKRKIPTDDEDTNSPTSKQEKINTNPSDADSTLALSGSSDMAEQEENGARDKGRKKKKNEERPANAEEIEQKPFQPFDYASAPSVLQQPKEKKSPKEKRKKNFNPYSGADGGPKGLTRKNQERQGRSSVFKN